MYVGTLITKIRQRTGKTRYSVDASNNPTEGIPQALVVDFLNEAKEFIQTAIISTGSTICDVSKDISIVAGTYEYQIADNVSLGNRISNVQFSNDGTERQFRDFPMLRDEQMNYLPMSFPNGYIRRGSRILTAGVPNRSGAKLRCWYPRTWDSFGLIVGTVSGDLTGPQSKIPLVADTYLSAPDLGQLNATSYICIVQSDGTMRVRNIPVVDYNASTREIGIQNEDIEANDGDFVVIGKDTTIDTDAIAPSASPLSPAVLQYIKLETQMRMFDVTTSVDALREEKFLRTRYEAIIEGYEDERDESDIPIVDPYAMS